MSYPLTRIFVVFLIFMMGVINVTDAQIIDHYAGTAGYSGWAGDGMPATMAQLDYPIDITVDIDGNVYIADMNNHAIRKITPNGIISTIAGSPGAGYSGDGGPATLAKLNKPVSVAVDFSGNIYVADQGNAVIRKIAPDGIITTIAGNGTEGYSGDGGQALDAELDLRLADLIVDYDGNLLVSHPESYVVRKISAAGIITTIAGNGIQGYSGDDGPATDAQFKSPRFLAVQPDGTIYISDPKTFTIRKIDPAGALTRFAGTQVNGNTGDGGPAENAQLGGPYGIARDNCNNLYITSYEGSVIRKINAAGIISTIAGNGIRSADGDGGLATAAGLWYPMALTSDYHGHILVTDTYNGRVRKVSVDVCDQIDIQSPGPVCALNVDKTIQYFTNAGCGLEPIWTFDPAHTRFVSAASGQAIFQFHQPGKTWVVGTINTDCNSYDDTLWVQVDGEPAALALGNDTTLCEGDSLVLKAGADYVQYIWQDGSSNTSFVAKSTGTYAVYVSNTCGDISSDEIVVTIPDWPELLSAPTMAVCANEQFSISANSAFSNYTWAPAASVNGQDALVSLKLSADMPIIVNALSPDGCTAKDTVNITLLYARPINLGVDTSVCSETFFTLNAGTGYTSYNWSDGSVDSELIGYDPGDYTVVAQDVNGCYARDTIIVSKFQQPVVSLGDDKDICSNQIIQLDAGNFSSYQWQDGSVARNLSIKTPGIYWVKATDQNHCMASDTIAIKNLLQAPASFIKPLDSICRYGYMEIIPAGNYKSYLWSTGATSSRTTINAPGSYSLTVTAHNGCATTENIKIIEKNCLTGVFLPNAFTPNFDGKNDAFKVTVHGKIVKYYIAVFNRFGEMVFTSKDPLKSWDGFYKGRPAETGNYVWTCVYQLDGESQVDKKGQILLIR